MNYMGSLTVYCILAGYAETKNPKTSDSRNIAKICTRLLYHGAMHQKVADEMRNRVDPEEQSDLSLHCLPRPICLKT